MGVRYAQLCIFSYGDWKNNATLVFVHTRYRFRRIETIPAGLGRDGELFFLIQTEGSQIEIICLFVPATETTAATAAAAADGRRQ